jgi:choline dehydrogenase-like flavoprotein
MFVDAQHGFEGGRQEVDICIIGGGVAGITAALEFDGKPLSVALLESGEFKYAQATQSLYEGATVGQTYERLDRARSRYWGGSSNCWGGWCRPMDAIDFEKRDWVDNSGWPFTKDTLAPYYDRAIQLLGLNPDYEANHWKRDVNRSNINLLPVDEAKLSNQIIQFTPHQRYGHTFRETLKQSKNVRIFLHSNAVSIRLDESGQSVAEVVVKTIAGRSFAIAARRFILAAGGIENARLLLSSNDVVSAGVGNQNDLVGRYFMDHPRIASGTIKLKEPWQSNRFYDVKFSYRNPLISVNGVSSSATIIPSRRSQETEHLLNARLYTESIFYGEDAAGGEAVKNLYQSLVVRRHGTRPSEVLAVLGSPINATRFTFCYLLRSQKFVHRQRTVTVVEPEPNPNSRVTLIPERDRIGMHRVQVDWRVGSKERRTIGRINELVDSELRRLDLGELQVDADLAEEAEAWPDRLSWCWHHMGTTRMHDNPRLGVVDRNCQVHGISNLYIAGSSVFPTCGNDSPTITIIALALRLAERISGDAR